MFFVVAYDIEDTKRRTKIHNTLKNYGKWIQYSVFECHLTKIQYIQLREDLDDLIDESNDKIRFYFLCEKCQKKVDKIGDDTTAISDNDAIII